MGNNLGSSLADSARLIDNWVAEQEQRTRKRKLTLTDSTADPKDLRQSIELFIADCVGMERGLERLQDAIKNAEPALAKMKSQAAKDEALLMGMLKSGGGEPISPTAPFVVAMNSAVAAITPKARQALGEIEQLMDQIERDRVLQDALPRGRADVAPIIKLLLEAKDVFEQMPRQLGLVTDLLYPDSR
jgi:hypothetical protein